MTQYKITKQMKETGIKFVKVKNSSDSNKVGIHLFEPTQKELEESTETAIKDVFPTIFIHTKKTWNFTMKDNK